MKTSFACFAFLAFMFPSCSEEKNNQGGVEADQSAVVVVEERNEIDNANNETTNTSETDTRPIYRQPENNQRKDDKVVIEASSTSFKRLDRDNNKIVNQEEFYNGLYTLMDADGNNAVDEAEFKKEKSFLSKNKNSKLNSFADWDSDANKQISKEELRNKLSSLIDIPDGERLAQNLYIVWDTDNDDKIEKLELENVVIRFDPDEN